MVDVGELSVEWNFSGVIRPPETIDLTASENLMVVEMTSSFGTIKKYPIVKCVVGMKTRTIGRSFALGINCEKFSSAGPIKSARW